MISTFLAIVAPTAPPDRRDGLAEKGKVAANKY